MKSSTHLLVDRDTQFLNLFDPILEPVRVVFREEDLSEGAYSTVERGVYGSVQAHGKDVRRNVLGRLGQRRVLLVETGQLARTLLDFEQGRLDRRDRMNLDVDDF